MVPVAATAWAAAWIATSETMAGFAVVVASVAVGIVVATLRRSAIVLSVAIVMTAIAGVGLIDVYRLRHGPVAQLASHEAVVSADLEIRSDPPREFPDVEVGNGEDLELSLADRG